MLIKLPYGSVICVLSFRLPANIAWLFWKTNEADCWDINDVGRPIFELLAQKPLN